MGQIKKLYQDSGNVETTVTTESNAVYPVTSSGAVYHQSSWGTLGSNQTVGSILTALDQGYQFIGVAGTSTTPGSYSHKVFYLASEVGTYSGFGGISVTGLCVLKNAGSGWSKEDLNITGGGGGGGDTPVATGGYIGTTAVRDTSGVQDLTGISNLYIGSGGKIYFGNSGDTYLEYTSSGFHFSKAVYSDNEISASGSASGGGGGGGGGSYSAGTGINISSSNVISLRTASASVLGGIKVGTGLSITSGGVLSVTGGGGTSYTAGNGISISSSTIAVKAGTGLAFDGSGNLYVTGGGGGGSTVTWGTYSASSHTIVLTVDGTSYTLCENGYSAGGGVSSESDPVFTASAAYGITSSDITNWNAKSNFSGSYTDLTNKPTSMVNPYALTFGSKTYDGSSAETIVASDLGALTTHQTIYTLSLNAGTFTAGTWTPTSANASFNIPTTLDHITDGDWRKLSDYVTIGTTQTITGAKTFTTNVITIANTSGISVNSGSYIEIGEARLVYDGTNACLRVTRKPNSSESREIGFYADGEVAASGAPA